MNELEVALCTTQKGIGWEANINWLWQFKLHYDEYSDDENGNDDEDGDNDGGIELVMVVVIISLG